ncbi:hypothetical protein BKH43_04225 [Helicobacter sp. 13S00401-1]|uniref:type IV pilus twitching motility protein PilT n=1 Tax=Helicobacter sp. 13S00401-1 TaxID=1905758 RepID=UPI000BC76577|nr:ATPase, T2SS/T4P/T4SS family [Helicobacter sp. 13S00401-1]PAF50770.1 hypothetical protein BKH43_04225 [Helicobacter sp. 13S00401-1]
MENLLLKALQKGASDLHISKDGIYFRVNKELLKQDISIDLESFIFTLKQNYALELHKSKTIRLKEVQLRASLYKSQDSLSLALRILSPKIPSFETLGLPVVMSSICSKLEGLVLVCGATGSGKSSTVASMIDYINTNFNKHILTIEDPVEYVHANKNSLISQREVGVDVSSFEEGLSTSLRQDPDVIVIGEILSPSILKEAIMLSLSGHLVISTFHASDAVSAILRILGSFKNDMRVNLADSLNALICQRLLLKDDAMRLECEILVNTTAIKSLIKDDKVSQIHSQIAMGREFGMQSFKDSKS